jgi:hypothetical protein
VQYHGIGTSRNIRRLTPQILLQALDELIHHGQYRQALAELKERIERDAEFEAGLKWIEHFAVT